MSKQPQKLYLPLKNITRSLNSNNNKMSYTGESGFPPNLSSSPMSALAFNLSELSTGRNTPRRRLSLNSVDTPPNDCDRPSSTERTLSAESGVFSESPIDDSPTLESLNLKRLTAGLHPDIPLEAFSMKKKTIAYRRISSQPLPTLRLDSPTDFLNEDVENVDSSQGIVVEESNSQDSGLGMEGEKRAHSMSSIEDLMLPSSPQSERLPSLEDMWSSLNFKAPKGIPPKRSRGSIEERYSEDTCSPIKYSPVKSSMPRPSFSKTLFSDEPEEESGGTCKKKKKLSTDDGFQELFEVENLKNEADDEVSSLISAKLLHRPGEDEIPGFQPVALKKVKFSSKIDDNTPNRLSTEKRGLLRSQSMDIRPRPSFKRCEPPQDHTPLQNTKRWRGDDDMSVASSSHKEETYDSVPPGARRLHRCHSETEAMIKSAVSRLAMEPDLIGDCSKPYCLPTIKGRHQDLKYISAETMSRLLASEYTDDIEDFHVIDCRYPYEYEGGHVQNALNIYTKDGIVDKYLKSPLKISDPSKRFILIFHCEFSSERGPGLFRFLRRHDRESNKECYPFLHYPEIYVLEGGYKCFFENYPHLCEPQLYKPMLDKSHAEDLRKFRAKAKSWAGEKNAHSRTAGLRNLKF